MWVAQATRRCETMGDQSDMEIMSARRRVLPSTVLACAAASASLDVPSITGVKRAWTFLRQANSIMLASSSSPVSLPSSPSSLWAKHAANDLVASARA